MLSKILTCRQACWAEFLSEFHFSTTYHPGCLETLPDALSCQDDIYPEMGEDFISKNEMNYQKIIKQDEIQDSKFFAVKVDSFSNLIYSIQKALWQDSQYRSILQDLDTPAGNLSKKIQSVQKDVKRKLEVAINRFKRYADKSRASPPVFNRGEMVWLSSKNIKSTRPTKILSEIWLVPFPILKKVRNQAYHLNRSPSTQSSIFPSWNQSRHQKSEIGIKSLLLHLSLKKRRSGKSLKYWNQSSREENSGIWWNGKASVKTQKDSLENQLKTSRTVLSLSRIFIIYILKRKAPIL
ncbi:hypothetical protein O181_015513 [Austropuccinia psidii MF-1]|uniref:Uncharacterized protein n=1 Tax=Austropuccinia psidii MF-1 TaxID=1389203 RepID=A0A9Q3C3D2_9BASI|nr:hypothetical protein [Austropuccinia psidii MF-1]